MKRFPELKELSPVSSARLLLDRCGLEGEAACILVQFQRILVFFITAGCPCFLIALLPLVLGPQFSEFLLDEVLVRHLLWLLHVCVFDVCCVLFVVVSLILLAPVDLPPLRLHLVIILASVCLVIIFVTCELFLQEYLLGRPLVLRGNSFQQPRLERLPVVAVSVDSIVYALVNLTIYFVGGLVESGGVRTNQSPSLVIFPLPLASQEVKIRDLVLPCHRCDRLDVLASSEHLFHRRSPSSLIFIGRHRKLGSLGANGGYKLCLTGRNRGTYGSGGRVYHGGLAQRLLERLLAV